MSSSADAAYDIVERHWPYDGPCMPERVASGSEALALLVRYLNNATGARRATATLPYAASIYRIISHVNAAAGGFPQLLAQLSKVAQRQAGDPTLYDDRRDRPGAMTATELMSRLSVARDLAQLLADQLASTAESASHLGNDDRSVTL